MRIALAGRIGLEQLGDLVEESTSVPAGLGHTAMVPEVRALVADGHDVAVVTLDPDVVTEAVVLGDRLTVLVGPFRQRRAARDGLRTERRYVREALLAWRPDVVHAHWTYEFALGALATGLPTVVTAHDAPLAILRRNLPTPRMGPLLDQFPAAAHWSVRAAMAAAVARKAPRLIAISPYVEHHFRAVLRYRGEISMIPNLMGEIPHRPAELDARRTGASARFATVLSPWSAIKNPMVAIEAFSTVRGVLPEATLHMIGPGFEPTGPAERWATSRGLAEGITFIGAQAPERVLELLAASDILVHPSLEESYGLAIAEAQFLGVAVIGGDRSGGVPWTLDYGRAGRLVDVRSASSLAVAMIDLANDDAARSRLADAGSELVRRRHDPARVLPEILAVLEDAASGTGSNGRRVA